MYTGYTKSELLKFIITILLEMLKEIEPNWNSVLCLKIFSMKSLIKYVALLFIYRENRKFSINWMVWLWTSFQHLKCSINCMGWSRKQCTTCSETAVAAIFSVICSVVTYILNNLLQRVEQYKIIYCLQWEFSLLLTLF